MSFPNHRLLKMWLKKCLKCLVLEDPWTGNMLNRPKPCFNLDSSTFSTFIDHCEGN